MRPHSQGVTGVTTSRAQNTNHNPLVQARHRVSSMTRQKESRR